MMYSLLMELFTVSMTRVEACLLLMQHISNMISAFVICSLEIIIASLAMGIISRS